MVEKNNRDAGELRRHRAHYDITEMWQRCYMFYKEEIDVAPMDTSA